MAIISRHYGYEQVIEVAQLLRDLSQSYSIITFQGPIGAGKTTLIRKFLRGLDITEPIVSPTFTYVSCYKTGSGRSVYHFDLYRIESARQFESMGFLEYLYESGALVLIEWPEIIVPLLHNPVCALVLDYASDYQQRVITIATEGV